MKKDDREKNNVEKKSSLLKKLFLVIFIPVIVFALVTYIGNVLVISEKVSSIFIESVGYWVEISLNVVLILFPVLAVAWQFKKNFFKYKTFSLDKVLDPKADNSVRKKFISSMNSDCPLKAPLVAACKKSDLYNAIKKYRDEAHSKMEQQIYQTASLAAISIVASPQSFGDAIFMLYWCCKVTDQVLSIYGFRPHGLALLKLYFNVICASLIAGSIEEITDNFFPGKKLPVVGGVIQASATAYAIFKAAYLTEYYLQHGVDSDHSVARSEAANRARKSLFFCLGKKEFWTGNMNIVSSLLSKMWDSIKNIFSNSNKQPDVE